MQAGLMIAAQIDFHYTGPPICRACSRWYCSAGSSRISSSSVKEIASFGGDISQSVPEFVAKMDSYFLTVRFMAGEEAQKFANEMYENGLAPYKDDFLSAQ